MLPWCQGAVNGARTGVRSMSLTDLRGWIGSAHLQSPPDGRQVLYQLRETDYAANKGTTGIWLLDRRWRMHKAMRLTDKAVSASSPRWSADGKNVYFLAKGGEAM